MNPDFRDLFAALSARAAEFLVVGGHAVMLYTQPRYTKDLDVWVRPTLENAERVHRALSDFGAPLTNVTVEDFATPGTIFQIGIAPNRVDVLTTLEGLDFEHAWQARTSSTYGGVPIGVLAAEDLITNKQAVARPQDLIDVAALRRALEK
ncbi:MAG: DUF6036 family nucleotidyltransferase [Polyangiaceae bacterium]